MELHQAVNAVVEIVKENYLASVSFYFLFCSNNLTLLKFIYFCLHFLIQVLSIPEYNFALGYASVKDYNTQLLPPKHFVPGQR